MPKYIGGSDAFRDFIASNLRYPQAALEANVEGSVIVEYDIHDNGIVQNPRIIKGIGHGCDAEAMRVVGLLRFEKVTNRGVRVKVTTKTTINFVLPGVKINYAVSEESKPQTGGNQPAQESPDKVVYEYTIKF